MHCIHRFSNAKSNSKFWKTIQMIKYRIVFPLLVSFVDCNKVPWFYVAIFHNNTLYLKKAKTMFLWCLMLACDVTTSWDWISETSSERFSIDHPGYRNTTQHISREWKAEEEKAVFRNENTGAFREEQLSKTVEMTQWNYAVNFPLLPI